MSLFGSLYAGVSGLNAQSRSLAMISDNVSNVSTTGYKGASAQFATLVTRAAGSTSYSPGGVRTSTSYAIETQGLIQPSARPTDIALSGAGFFVVNGNADATGERLYSRAGAFSADASGNLVSPSGSYLQGWRLDAAGAPVNLSALETVNTTVATGVAKPTSAIEIGANLDADQAPATGYTAGNIAAFAAGSAGGIEGHFTRDIEVVDSLGRARPLKIGFLNISTAAAPNQWAYEVYTQGSLLRAATYTDGMVGSGVLDFNTDGSQNAASVTSAVAAAAGSLKVQWAAVAGAADNDIQLDFGAPGTFTGVTQLRSPTDIAFISQDGQKVGQLSGVSVSEDGFVTASFTNGTRQRIYQLPIATFPNAAGLDPRSGNLYSASDAAGAVALRGAGTGGAGKVAASALESANVDLAEEFTKMIVTQRAYSANAKIISTADQMLDELVNLKR